MHARSAVVDLYGDHLRRRGWWAPVSAVVALSATVGVRPPAARTAISRLVAQGWLTADPRAAGRGYAASAAAQDRWDLAHARVYAAGPGPWDGRWHVVHVDAGGERRRRDQVGTTLSYLGYGRLGGGTWVSPRPSPELAVSLDRLGARWTAVHGALDAPSEAPALAAQVWDLSSLGSAYARFEDLAVRAADEGAADARSAYAARTRLVHEWRRFLFLDPDLPAAVLPSDWAGHRARQVFLATAATLAPAADRFVELTLAASAPAPGRSSSAASARLD